MQPRENLNWHHFIIHKMTSEKITHIYDVQGMISENMSIMFNNYPLPLFKPWMNKLHKKVYPINCIQYATEI